MTNKKLFELSKKSQYIAYSIAYKYDQDFGEEFPLSLAIKIRNTKTNKVIATITPTTADASVEILKWESNKKLFYIETNENKSSKKEMTYTIK